MERRVGFTIDTKYASLTAAKREVIATEKELKDLRKATKDNIGAQKAAAAQFAQLEGKVRKVRTEYSMLQKEAFKVRSTMMKTPLSSIGSNFLLLAGAVTAVVGTIRALTRGWGASITAFREQEEAIASLNAALDGNKGLTASLVAYASVVEEATAFQDDQIIAAEAMISAFVKEESQIKALTDASADLARRQGIDIVSAADQVTKAFIGESLMLGRTKIKLDGTAGSTKRFESIVRELNKAMGDQAEAFRRTESGSLTAYENRINNVQEEIGEKLLPVTLKLKEMQLQLVEAIIPVIDFLKENTIVAKALAVVLGGVLFNSVFKLLGTFLKLAPAISGMTKAIGINAAAGSLRGALVSLGGLLGPAGLIIGGMFALDRIIMGVTTHADVLTGEINRLNKALETVSDNTKTGVGALPGLERPAGTGETIGGDFGRAALGAEILKLELKELPKVVEDLVPPIEKAAKAIKELEEEMTDIPSTPAILKVLDALGKASNADKATLDLLNAQLVALVRNFKAADGAIDHTDDAMWGPLSSESGGDTDEFKAKLEERQDILETALFATQDVANQLFNNNLDRIQRERDAQLQAIDAKQEALLNSEEFTSEEQLAIQSHFDAQRAAIEKKQLKKFKQNAIAQALINGALATTNILATTPKVDFGVTTAILLALNAVTTALAVANISAQETFKKGGKLPKAARGIDIGGKRHSQGGTQVALDGVPVAEAEEGEGLYILKREAHAELRALSDMNVRHGGVQLSTPRMKMALGGQVQQGLDTARMAIDIGNEIARQIKQIPVVNNAMDTLRVQRKVVNIQTEATF